MGNIGGDGEGKDVGWAGISSLYLAKESVCYVSRPSYVDWFNMSAVFCLAGIFMIMAPILLSAQEASKYTELFSFGDHAW